MSDRDSPLSGLGSAATRGNQKVKFENSYKRGLFRSAVCWIVVLQFVAANAQDTATSSPFRTSTSAARRPNPRQRWAGFSRTTTALAKASAATTPAKNVDSGFSTTTGISDPKLLDLGLLETVRAALAVLPVWQTVGEGEPLTLSIGVDLGPLVSLQWYFNGQPIPGETRKALTLASVQSAQVGRYQLQATLLGITLLSIPTDVQINATDNTVDRAVAAFDELSDAKSLFTFSKSTTQAKSGTTSHGYSGTQIFSTLGATKDDGEPNHCGISGGASEWYAWQSPTNGTAVINTDGSNFDTVLAVYIGPGDSYTTLTNVACDNDSGANGKTSRVTFTAKTGTIYYIAVDGVGGASGTVKLNFIVGTPPAITAQPASRTAALGAAATLNVGAVGFPSPRYQWMFNGANISNATNASLTLNGITQASFGNYSVRVTNAFNALLSSPANLMPETPLHFSSQRSLSNGFHVSLIGPAGTNYVIECSTNLTTWIPLTTNRTQTGLVDYLHRFDPSDFPPPAATNGGQFYRARAEP